MISCLGVCLILILFSLKVWSMAFPPLKPHILNPNPSCPPRAPPGPGLAGLHPVPHDGRRRPADAALAAGLLLFAGLGVPLARPHAQLCEYTAHAARHLSSGVHYVSLPSFEGENTVPQEVDGSMQIWETKYFSKGLNPCRNVARQRTRVCGRDFRV